jgi:hydrogenase expression/formation protein HypD
MEAILASSENQVEGFLAAGHVCTVMGYWEYEPIAEKYAVPIVVTGFEPVDLLQGILNCVVLLESKQPIVGNAYLRLVQRDGNRNAIQLLEQVFTPVSRIWRGIGEIPRSGLGLKSPYDAYDSCRRFSLPERVASRETLCRAGEVLRGTLKPCDCPAFGQTCTPRNPLGAPMVSSEGACAAYYRYRPSQAS